MGQAELVLQFANWGDVRGHLDNMLDAVVASEGDRGVNRRADVSPGSGKLIRDDRRIIQQTLEVALFIPIGQLLEREAQGLHVEQCTRRSARERQA